MSDALRGRVVRLGDDVNTDLILPGAYLNLTGPEELGEHLLEGYDAELGRSIRPGDVLVAGRDFGSGSSREQAPVAILARGVAAVIAASFARIFLRNAINLGLPILENPAASAGLRDGEQVSISLAGGTIGAEGGRLWTTPPQPLFVQELLAAGGIVPWTRRRLGLDPSDDGE